MWSVGIKSIEKASAIIFSQEIPYSLLDVHQDCSSQGLSETPWEGKELYSLGFPEQKLTLPN